MTFQSVDKRRLSYLLGVGTRDGELKKFFDECLKALIFRGARIRNAPHGNAARIKAIAERLPPSAEDVLRQWFKRNITVLDSPSSSDLVAAFRTHERDNTSPTEEESPHLARSCLMYLFADEPDEDFLSFLRSPIPELRPVEVALLADAPVAEPNESGPLELSHSALLTLLAFAFEAGDIGDTLDQVPEVLASFVEGLAQIRRGDERSAQDALSVLDPDSEEAKLLARSIKRMRSSSVNVGPHHGLLISQPSEFQGDVEIARTRVFAYCTNDRPTATFVKPLGVVRQGRLETFSDDQRLLFFPDAGDVMSFPGTGRPRQPARGEVGLWDIDEHPTDKRTHCHIVRESAELYSIVSVPVHSSDADAVRSYIKRNFAVGSTSQKNRLYELLDGVIVAPQSFRADLSRDETYETPFSRWSQLVGFAFEDQRLVAGPLPEAESTYDCAPISIAVRSLLRTLRDQQKIQLTRAQVRDVVSLFQGGEDIVSRQRMARIVDRMDAVETEETVLQDMLDFILETPRFKKRIEDGVQLSIEQRCQERDDLQTDISRLSTERVAVESRLRSAEKAARKQASDTANVVKEAFDRAVSSGIETLVSARIIETLNGPPERAIHREETEVRGEPCVPLLPSIDRDDAFRILKACGINRRFAIYLIAALSSAWRSGLVVFLKGEFARQVGSTLARIDREVASFDVPVGQTSRPKDLSFVIAANRALVLFNANLSDFELYASEVTDNVLARIARVAGDRQFSVLGSLVDGDLAVPLPSAVKRFSVTIDLQWAADYELSEGGRSTDLAELREHFSGSLLDRSLADVLLTEIESLPELERTGVVSVFSQAILHP